MAAANGNANLSAIKNADLIAMLLWCSGTGWWALGKALKTQSDGLNGEAVVGHEGCGYRKSMENETWIMCWLSDRAKVPHFQQ